MKELLKLAKDSCTVDHTTDSGFSMVGVLYVFKNDVRIFTGMKRVKGGKFEPLITVRQRGVDISKGGSISYAKVEETRALVEHKETVREKVGRFLRGKIAGMVRGLDESEAFGYVGDKILIYLARAVIIFVIYAAIIEISH